MPEHECDSDYRSREELLPKKRRYFYRIGPVVFILVALVAAGLTQLTRVWWLDTYVAFQSWHVGRFNRACSQISFCRDTPGTLEIPEWAFAGLLFVELLIVGLLISTVLPLIGILLRRAPLWITLGTFLFANAASIIMALLMKEIPNNPALQSFAQEWTAPIVLALIALRFAESIVRTFSESVWMLLADFVVGLGCFGWAIFIFAQLDKPVPPLPTLLTTALVVPIAEFIFQYALYRSGKSRF